MKPYLLLLIFLFLNASQSISQTIKPIEDGLSINRFYHQQGANYYLNAIDNNNTIYALLYDTITSTFNYGKEFSIIRLQVFNGLAWLTTKPIKLFKNNGLYAPLIRDIAVFKNEVYVIGNFDSSDNNLGAGIIKFNGSTWQSCNLDLKNDDPELLSVNRIEANENAMIIYGEISTAINQIINGIVIFDGISWQGIGANSLAGFNNTSTSGLNFKYVNNLLYVFEKNKTSADSIRIGGYSVLNIGVFVNGKFNTITPLNKKINDLIGFNNKLCVLTCNNLFYTNGISILDNNIWRHFPLPDSLYTTNYLGSMNNNNQLYLFFQNPNTNRIETYIFDGTQFKTSKGIYIANTYINLSFKNNAEKAIISGNFNTSSNDFFKHQFNSIAQITTENSSKVKAISFWDINENGVFDNNELLLNNVFISNNKAVKTKTNLLGIANLYFNANEIVKLSTYHHLDLNCNTQFNKTLSIDSNYLVYFPFVSSGNGKISIDILSNTNQKIISNFETYYYLNLSNSKTTNIMVNIKIKHSKKVKNLVFVNCQNRIIDQNDSQFIVSDNISPFEVKQYIFKLQYLENDFNINEKPSIIAQLLNSNSAAEKLEQTIVDSLNPNKKIATPDVINNRENKIRYHIYFQNTQSDTSINITVIDTFGSLLDLRKVVIGGASHPYTYSVENNVFRWHFKNIKLAPKAKNEEKSRGFVSFTTYTNEDSKVGDTIINSAAIYFDYQKPKFTNQAEVVFNKKTSILNTELNSTKLFYPNPNNGILYFNSDIFNHEKLTIIDNKGSIVLETENKDEVQLPANLMNGIYWIKNETNTINQCFILMR